MDVRTVQTSNSSSSLEGPGNAMHKTGKGQLKLTVYVNNGLMTVHVMQARNLKSKSRQTCNASVKVTITPDDLNKRKCKTSVVTSSNQPRFDQRFTLEVNDSDYDKRLYISVCHKDSLKRSSEFLGCMSFGVKKLMKSKKHVSGWYFLLTEEAGRDKHLQSIRRRSSAANEKLLNNNSINKTVQSTSHVKDAFTLVIHKRESGFGFTLSGSNPVHVDKIESGSASAEAGLLSGDQITSVNNLNVARASFQNVAKIIKNSGSPLMLDVERKCEPGKCPWHAYLKHGQASNGQATSGQAMEVDNILYNTPQEPVYEEIDECSHSRQEAMQRLLDCEEQFVSTMQAGIQRYSRPLRHRFLNPPAHRAVFQNVEKLVTLSQYHSHQLRSSTSAPSSGHNQNLDVCGQVYMSQMPFLCEAYETYCAGLRKADRVMTLLVRSKNDLSTFLDKCAREERLDVGSFIHKPAEHLTGLLHHLHEVITATNIHHHDYQCLQKVAQSLQQCYARIHGAPISTDPSSSSSSSTSSQHSASQYTTISSLASSSSASSVSSSDSVSRGTSHSVASSVTSLVSSVSVDAEVMNLQNVLEFADNVKAFQLAVPSRHLIYAGELLKIEEKLWTKLHVLLFTDMILLTKMTPDGHMTVVHDPIFINNVISAEFDCAHPSEFQLELEPASEESFDTWEGKTLSVRAPNMEQKCVWKSLMEHRIASQKTLQELAPAICHARSFIDACDYM